MKTNYKPELTFALELLGTADPEWKGSNGQTAIDLLLQCSNDEDPIIREGAIMGLENQEYDARIKDRLNAIALTDPLKSLRDAAREALVQFEFC